MKVVSNSSILIGLSAIGRLELLRRRFPEGVIVPDAVWQEVVETGHGRTGAEQVANAEWICRQKIQNNVFATALQAYLDQGEAEVIALGQEIGADLLLLDEKSARSADSGLNLPPIPVQTCH
jgi:uncharacterized protein